MDFNQFLRESGVLDSVGGRDLVGLTFYYIENHTDMDAAKTSDVRQLIEDSRLSLSGNSVPSYVKRLKENSTIVPKNSASRYPEYVLSFDGLQRYEDLLSEHGISTERTREDHFIEVNTVASSYYRKLIDDINKCYRYGINDATLVLTRKLFENMIIDTLRAEFGGAGTELYFNPEIRQFLGLGVLCGTLSGKIPELENYSRHLNKDLIERLEEFKERGNREAHSVRVNISNDELEAMRSDATELTTILYDLREEVRIANGSNDST